MARKKHTVSGKSSASMVNPVSSASVREVKPQAVDVNTTSKTAAVNVTMRDRTASAALDLPQEVERGDWTVVILALMMFLTPAIGVPNELMLQDTLKSIVVSFAAVGAGLLFFWQQRNPTDAAHCAQGVCADRRRAPGQF